MEVLCSNAKYVNLGLGFRVLNCFPQYIILRSEKTYVNPYPFLSYSQAFVAAERELEEAGVEVLIGKNGKEAE